MIAVLRAIFAAGLALICETASAQDYSRYRVIDTTTLDLMAGPANTAALLSPDGSRLLHIHSDICLLAPADGGSWSKVGCTKNEPKFELRAPEDMLWSPRSDRLVLPTFVSGLMAFRDTDIRLFDPRTMAVTNLTDDGLDDGLLDNQAPGNFDLIARWVDEDTIVFLRYPVPKGGIGKGGWPSLMTVDAAGGEPKVLFTIPGAERVLVYALAVSPDGRRIAYSFDDRNNASVGGIFMLDIGSAAVERVATAADIGQPPVGLAFSADGNFLLLLGTNETGLDARVLDPAAGKVVPVDTTHNITGVAWSPTGSALAYVSVDHTKSDEPGGLFLANRPGEPGRKLLTGALMPPVCCGRLPFTWASNDTMILGNAEKHDAPLFVRLGQ